MRLLTCGSCRSARAQWTTCRRLPCSSTSPIRYGDDGSTAFSSQVERLLCRVPNIGTYSAHLDTTHEFLADPAIWKEVMDAISERYASTRSACHAATTPAGVT